MFVFIRLYLYITNPMSPPPASIIIKPVNAPQSTSLTPVTAVRPFTVAIIPNMAVNALVRNNSSNRNSFSLVAWSMAAGVLILISAGTLFLRYLLPEKELRLELLFLTNALTAILHATREKETPGKEKIRYTNPLNKTGNIKIPGNQRKAR